MQVFFSTQVTQRENGLCNPAHLMKYEHPGFANRLNRLLNETGHGGKTDKEIGRLFGVSNTTAWNWRNGVKLPAMETAITIATRLDVCVEYLLTGRGPKSPGNTEDDGEGLKLDLSALSPESAGNLEKAFLALAQQVSEITKPNKR